MRDDIFKAIDINDVATLKTILEKEPRLASSRSDDGLSAVLFSLYIEKPEITDALLSCKPELDIFDLSALAGTGQISIILATNVKAVHEYSGDGFTALHIASYFGNLEVVELLLENGADVNKTAMNGSELSALQSAVSRGHKNVVSILLEYGANPNSKMVGGFTPLMSAAALGFEDTVDLLLKYGADISIESDDGRRAVDFAQPSKSHSIIDKLAI